MHILYIYIDSDIYWTFVDICAIGKIQCVSNKIVYMRTHTHDKWWADEGVLYIYEVNSTFRNVHLRFNDG